MLHIFMDTMIYLHYKPVSEMDFKELFGVEEVTLQVPRVTIRELDGHKDSHNSNRVRDRSRSVLKGIEKAMAGGEKIKPGVFLKHCLINPSKTIEAHGLEAAWNDDRLVATVLDFSISVPGERVILITQDTGAKITCAHLGVECAELPEKYKLPPEQDEYEKEIKKLRTQVQRLQTALPRIKFGFGSAQEEVLHVSINELSAENIESEVSEKISALKIDVPEINKSTSSAAAMNPFLVTRFAVAIPSDDEYERYNNERIKYFDSYERYMRADFSRSRRLSLSFQFDLSISNIGTCPAEDVGVWLHFPDGFALCDVEDLEEEIGKEVIEPVRPPEPRSAIELFQSGALFWAPAPHLLSTYSNSFDPLSALSRVTVKRTNSYEVERNFIKVKHGVSEPFATLVVLFESFEQVKSFSAEYRITVGNLPEAVTGELNFVIGKLAVGQ